MHRLARRLEQEIPCRGKAAADHDGLWAKDVDEASNCRAELPADSVEDPDRGWIAFGGEADEPMGVDCRSERLLRKLCRSRSAHIALEVTAPRTGSLARDAVVNEHGVAELPAVPEQLAVDDDPSADAC